MTAQPEPQQAPLNVALGSLGPLVTAVDIDAWVLEAIGTWLPTYLTLFERDRGLAPGAYPRPASGHILTAISDAEFTDRQLPAIIVTALTNTGEPTRNADWSYAAVARVNVSAVVRGRTPAETRQTAAVYEACCRQLLSQRGVPGVARQRWRGWQILPVPDADSQGRYLAAGVTIFDFSIDQMAQSGFTGPSVPIDDAMTQEYVATVPVDSIAIAVEGIAPAETPPPTWAGAATPDTASVSAGSPLTVTLTGRFVTHNGYQVGLPHGGGYAGYLWSDSSSLLSSDGITLQADFSAPSGVTPGSGPVAVYDGSGITTGQAMFTWTA